MELIPILIGNDFLKTVFESLKISNKSDKKKTFFLSKWQSASKFDLSFRRPVTKSFLTSLNIKTSEVQIKMATLQSSSHNKDAHSIKHHQAQ